ncbi:hypothetical protein [Sodalis sp. RH20]|uniref:hypothetical protein n=1 Tax=unclassified Sodalis (in: enterobacteria) TaxID=2636512 RepID=UPI0039B4B51F
MSVTVQATKLVNTVEYKTDLASLKNVMNQMRKLQGFSSKLMSKNVIDNTKAQILQSRLQAQEAKTATAVRISESKIATNAIIADQKKATAVAQAEAKKLNTLNNQWKSAGNKGMVGKPDTVYNAELIARQTAAMTPPLKQTHDDARIATERKMRESAFQSDIAHHDKLVASAWRLNQINKADVVTRYKAITAARQVLQAEKEGRYTASETAHEMRKITDQLRAQARLQTRVNREQSKSARSTIKRTGGVRSPSGFAGVAGLSGLFGLGLGASYIGRGAVANTVEREKDYKQAAQYGVGRTEMMGWMNAFKQSGADVSSDKFLDQMKDYREKTGELTSQGQLKTDKHGKTTLSGAGEMGDVINAYLQRGGTKTGAESLIKQLQSMNWPEYLVFMKTWGKQMGFNSKEMAQLTEIVDDGSLSFNAINESALNVTDTMKLLKDNGYTLSDQQSKAISSLQSMLPVFDNIRNALSDKFTAGFANGLGLVNSSANDVYKQFKDLNPIMESFGQFTGETLKNLMGIVSWFNTINPENKHEQLSDNGIYTKDSAVGDFMNHINSFFDSFVGANSFGGRPALPTPGFDLSVPNMLAYQNATASIPIINQISVSVPQSNISVNVDDSRLFGVFDAVADSAFEYKMESQTNDLYSFQLAR